MCVAALSMQGGKAQVLMEAPGKDGLGCAEHQVPLRKRQKRGADAAASAGGSPSFGGLCSPMGSWARETPGEPRCLRTHSYILSKMQNKGLITRVKFLK